MKALLIIDMQIGSFTPMTVRHDALKVIDQINKLSNHFRANKDKVIFIQHDGSKEHHFLPGTEEWEILAELTKHPDDLIVSKTANDAFYKTDLQTLLTEYQISDLFVTGCATDFCVDTTIKSAVSKDYRVTVIADGHTTADRPHIAAAALIKHYNWLWADMTPTVGKVQVVEATDILGDPVHHSMS